IFTFEKKIRLVVFFQGSIVFTLNNSQQNDNDEEEESDIKDHSIKLVFISSRILDLISNASTTTSKQCLPDDHKEAFAHIVNEV
uniref:Uncharacterized protein n=1 Tax=Seriola lalandi dorsalis TaxID=1841481 RepID=A0A3B4Y7Y1_SERLL